MSRFSPSSLLGGGGGHQQAGHHLPHVKGDFDAVAGRKESRQSNLEFT
jgi:hypothetical protein